MLVRRASAHLERTIARTLGRDVDKDQGAHATHCFGYALLRHARALPDTLTSVNSISWAPHELGAILACASSDGKLSVLTFKGLFRVRSTPKHTTDDRAIFFLDDGQWVADIFNGHAIGCNAVSWAPAIHPGSLIHPHQPGAPAPPAPFKRFASAGCDNLVKIWSFREGTQAWVEEETLEGHGDWVRDVAWAPNIGLPRSYIATASQVSCGDFERDMA